MKITRFLVIFFAFLLLISYFVLDIHDEKTLMDLMNPLVASSIAAFTFCFSLTFLVFNSAIQRFGRGSYDLLDKKPLLALIVAFFVWLLSSIVIKIGTIQSFVPMDQVGKVAILSNFLFLGLIVFYFFWLIDHVSSVSMLRNLLRKLKHSVPDFETQRSRYHLKTLVQMAHRVIDERDYASFDFLVKSAGEIQSELVDIFCKTPLDNRNREALESMWVAFNTSVAIILERAAEKDSSYLRDIGYFYQEKLEAIFSSERSYGTLSPAFSDTIIEFELDIIHSFLWFLTQKIYKSKRLVGQNYLEYFLEQTFISLDVANEATSVPANILDYFYLISKKRDAVDFLLRILEINVQLYPYISSFSQPIASDMRSAITRILEILPKDSLALAEVIMMKEKLMSEDLSFELKAYVNELIAHVSEYFAEEVTVD